MKSPFRWAGSKAKLTSRLAALVPKSFDRYVEPFAGSACLFFFLLPQRAILGDTNQELITAYKQLKSEPEKVYRTLTKFPDTSSKTYYLLRSQDPRRLSPVRQAARFIFLNRFCFNGLYRTNTKGNFNVPYGGARTGDLPTLRELVSAATALQKAAIQCISFEYLLRRAQSGDFVYLDPPYSISSRRVFNNYSSHIFTIENLVQLRHELERLHEMGARFLVSFGLSKEGIYLGRGFNIRHAVVQRQISGFATHRRKARELLITNY
jgi:DNA adenine methylase